MQVDSVLITKDGVNFFKLRTELWKKNQEFYSKTRFRKATEKELDAYAIKHGLIQEEEE